MCSKSIRQHMNYLEIAGTIAGILYLYWEYKASSWLWVASIAMPALYLAVYYHAGLYADFAISIYYILASTYGLIVWLIKSRRGKNRANKDSGNAEEGIMPTPRNQIIWLCTISLLLTLILGFILSRFTDSTVPWADAFTTALSIVALWMLSRKYLEQWLVWIVVDATYVFLYAYKDLWFTSALYLAYTIVAIFGYFKWKRMI